ncbi:MAG: hypothetical protein Q9223_004977 [Gallowayella weberi]
MPLRTARHHDLFTIAVIYAAAFWDERVIGELMHPHRQTFPQDYLRYWQQQVAEWYWSYSHQIVVSYELRKSEKNFEEEVLTGVADWIRYGQGWEQYWGIWGWWDFRNVLHRFVMARNAMTLRLYPNRAADPAMANIGSTINPLVSHFWSGSRRTGWYLNFLGVHPDFQRQGYGTSLAEWGIERAKQEKVAASVISGVGRDPFYRRCGFDVEVGKSTEGEGNPLAGKVDGAGTILFRDPELQGVHTT